MALHGKPQKVVDDVCEVGKSTGLKIKGDYSNMFSVLSRGRGDGVKKERKCEGGKGRELLGIERAFKLGCFSGDVDGGC